MSGYTKGPWHIEADSLHGNSYVGISGEGWDELATVVVRMKSRLETSPEGVANARLIAAAPELVEALGDMLELFADHAQYDEEGHEAAAIERAMTVLAKVRG